MSAGGRPTKFKEEYIELAKNYSLLGAIDEEMAEFFNVSVSTFNKWKKDHPKFSESIRSGKVVADAKVANSLYNRALGYSHPEDKIFNANGEPLVVPTTKHYPPDTKACEFWLKNRQPDKFKDKHEVDHKNNGGSFNAESATTEELIKRAEASRLVEDAS